MDIKVAVNVPANLMQYLSGLGKAALAFSGGVDSTYLMYAAKRSRMNVRAYYANTQFQPAFELDDAIRAARKIGVPMTVIRFDVLNKPGIRDNGPDRCYACKTEIFSRILKIAAKDGFATVMDGTNASDDEAARPGMRALKELAVVSPLRDCGITKPQVRQYSRTAGLFTWDKPAYACLATRVDTGIPYTDTLLQRVEVAENLLMDMGFTDFRVRTDGRMARLQLRQADWDRIAPARDAVYNALLPYFESVVLDMKIRE